jgi:hypothetical protein
MQVIQPQACKVSEHGVIRVDQPQGDLVAWSPGENTIAYVASTQASTWNVGDLTLLTAPSFDGPQKLAAQAVGELVWSPEGRTLAYLTLRRSDSLYSIGLINPDGQNSRDLFPGEAARTDNYSSQKAILGWVNEGRLQVLTSCGLDCMQRMDFGILTGLSTSVGVPIQRSWDLWSVTISQPAVIPSSFADLIGQLNWSPDEKSIAYIDENGSVWIIGIDAGTQYPIDIGAYGTAVETDWSADSQFLAVRADQYMKIYSFSCP